MVKNKPLKKNNSIIEKPLPNLEDKTKKKIKYPQFSQDKKKNPNPKNYPSLQLKTERDIAMDFAVKVYKRFDKIVKSIILFGSAAKQTQTLGSDIDIVMIIDDVSLKWDQELIAWYREELDKILQGSPYQKALHINTVKISTWWEDLIRGEPVVINILRYGEALLDYAGFFEPLKYLLLQGKIRPSPEAIYVSLQRAPMNLARSKAAELGVIDGLYWAMVDAAHASLIAINILPPSPEHLAIDLKDNFVGAGKLDMKYVLWYRDLLVFHKKIAHGEIKDLRGADIDLWQDRTKEFIDVMVKLVSDIVNKK